MLTPAGLLAGVQQSSAQAADGQGKSGHIVLHRVYGVYMYMVCVCICTWGQMAERLGSWAINQIVVGSIPGHAK